MKSRVRKPSTKIQNAHKKDSLHVFLYFTSDLQRRPNQTDGFSKPNRNRTRVFLKTEPNLKNPFRTSLVCIEYGITFSRLQQ